MENWEGIHPFCCSGSQPGLVVTHKCWSEERVWFWLGMSARGGTGRLSHPEHSGFCLLLNHKPFFFFLQYHSLLTSLHPFHSRFIMLSIKGKKFLTVLPRAVYFLWGSIALKELGQTQELVVDSHLTALGIKESTQQGQSMLEMERSY